MYLNERGDLVLWDDPISGTKSIRYGYIPAKHVRLIRKKLEAGEPYSQCLSPSFPIDRGIIAFILCLSLETRRNSNEAERCEGG